MKAFFLCALLIPVSSCKTDDDTSSQRKNLNDEFVQIAVVTIDSSEKICKSLNNKGFDCFASGSLLYGLYTRESDAQKALLFLKSSDDWGRNVWEKPIEDPNFEPTPIPKESGFPAGPPSELDGL